MIKCAGQPACTGMTGDTETYRTYITMDTKDLFFNLKSSLMAYLAFSALFDFQFYGSMTIKFF